MTNRLPLLLQKLLGYAITLGITVFGGILVYSGQDLVARTTGDLSATLRYPIELLYYPAPICGALIIIHSLSHLFKPKEEE
jgi:TRAP-type transport system small permease protein